jgi:hypothetical protein
MAKFLSNLFGKSSSSSKYTPDSISATEVNQSSPRTGAYLENLSSYPINPKELDKNKLHKASWEGNLNIVERLARPDQIDLKDQHFRVISFPFSVISCHFLAFSK